MSPYVHTFSHAVHPLNRPHWSIADQPSRLRPLAELNGTLHGIQTLVQMLERSEAYRVQRSCCDSVPDDQLSLDAVLTEGVFTALHYLCELALDKADALLTKAK